MKANHFIIFFVAYLFLPNSILGQASDSINLSLDSIIISASRIQSPIRKMPLAVSRIQSNHKFTAHQKSSIKEFLINQPGVFIQSAANFAQDARISIRGFGARSAFGIRGVKIIVDGIPESTPDGQGQIDNINLKSIASIDVLKGPASGLYGNASGGVIVINNQQTVHKKYLELDNYYGSNQTLHSSIASGLKLNNSDLILNGSFFRSTGYRHHSKSQTNILSAHWKKNISRDFELRLGANYTFSPEAQDPGSLNFDDATADRRQARQQNVDFDAGETLDHLKLTSSLKVQKGNKTYASSLYYHRRNFEGNLPFQNGGIVNLSRDFFGHHSHVGLKSEMEQWENKLLLGYDVQLQNDDRKRYDNMMGVPSDLSLDQLEAFGNVALFVEDRVVVNDRFYINMDGRYDRNNIRLDDRFLDDEDDSYSIDYNSLNYGIGLGVAVCNNTMPYVRIASSFETPTLSELFANPSGLGFNDQLVPNKAYNYELGLKSKMGNHISLDANLFFIQSSNEILPFELEEFPGRDFFRNAGSTNRLGTELFLDYHSHNNLEANLSYSWSQFTFNEYQVNNVDLNGNHLPGIPIHTFACNLFYNLPLDITVMSYNQWVSQLYADDQNNVSVDGYALSDLKLQKAFTIGMKKWHLYGGVNNLFNEAYFDNVRINAFGARYYEAAIQRNYYIGFKLRLE